MGHNGSLQEEDMCGPPSKDIFSWKAHTGPLQYSTRAAIVSFIRGRRSSVWEWDVVNGLCWDWTWECSDEESSHVCSGRGFWRSQLPLFGWEQVIHQWCILLTFHEACWDWSRERFGVCWTSSKGRATQEVNAYSSDSAH